jgi:hypothetical protein
MTSRWEAKEMKPLSRRTFLRDSVAVVAGTALGSRAMTAISAENARGANERVNIALVGCGDRGNFVARGMIEKGASITFLCDLQPDRLEKSWQFLSEV